MVCGVVDGDVSMVHVVSWTGSGIIGDKTGRGSWVTSSKGVNFYKFKSCHFL